VVFKLIIEDDEGHTTVVPLVKDEITIGRKEGNTIRLTERNVSRHHARLIRSNGSFFIEDLDSYNGVKVNGDRIATRTTIREGDLVEIGDYHLALQQTQEQPEVKPPPVPSSSPPSLPTQSDGATAVLRLPVDKKEGPEVARAREIPADQVACLVTTTTELAGQRFQLARTEMTIGRTEENDIVVPHRSISAQHAKIVFDAGVYRVIDMDSANGVLVNGEEYARVDLRNGDIIELGHVKLRFVPAGEELPDTAPQPAAVAAQDTQQTVLEAPLMLPRKKFPLVPVLAGVVLLLLGGSYLVFFRGGQESGATTTPAKTSAVTANTNKPQENPAARLYKEGLAKFKQGDYTAARVTLQAALQADPHYPGVQTMLEKVKASEKDSQLLNQARQAMDEQHWDDAWKLFAQISPESPFASEVTSLRTEVKRKVITYHLNKARLAMKSKDLLAVAERHLRQVTDVDPGNPVAARLGRQVKRLRSASSARVASAPVRPVSQRREKPRRSGDAWKRTGISKRDVTTAIKNRKPRQAIRLLERVLEANPRDCYALAQMGAAYIWANNRNKGYEFYKRFLRFCPRHKAAPQVRGIVKEFENQMRGVQ